MPNVSIGDEDFLAVTSDGLFAAPACYDRIIANPPYGGWQDYARRRELKMRYPDLYVKETYGLFLHNSIRVLRPGGVLVFIVPDTFLNLHMHTPLRRFILDNCKIRRISLFPSSFFPGVRFGYSKLCVVTLDLKQAYPPPV
jgi:type I restriction-modification system DNA methylase subunit